MKSGLSLGALAIAALCLSSAPATDASEPEPVRPVDGAVDGGVTHSKVTPFMLLGAAKGDAQCVSEDEPFGDIRGLESLKGTDVAAVRAASNCATGDRCIVVDEPCNGGIAVNEHAMPLILSKISKIRCTHNLCRFNTTNAACRFGRCVQTWSERELTLDIRDENLADVLRYLGTVGGLDVELHPRIHGQITMKFIGSYYDLLNQLIHRHGLLAKLTGHRLRLAPASESAWLHLN
jgi:hypothetical protein